MAQEGEATSSVIVIVPDFVNPALAGSARQ
jgi:hypothetical protein